MKGVINMNVVIPETYINDFKALSRDEQEKVLEIIRLQLLKFNKVTPWDDYIAMFQLEAEAKKDMSKYNLCDVFI